MSNAKHTPGPLTVRVSDKWPFRIETFDANGEVVFSADMPCYSTKDKSSADAISCRRLKHEDREKFVEINERAIADEVLRAAAPELLYAAQAARDVLATAIRANWEGATDEDVANHIAIKRLDAAITKAKGE